MSFPCGAQAAAALRASASPSTGPQAPTAMQSKNFCPTPLSCSLWHVVPPAQHSVPGQQRPPQVGPAQEATHAPLAHACPVGQRLPQAPQFAGSVLESTQAWAPTGPQRESPVGQPQADALQTWPGGQLTPHAPQFLGSVVVFTQVWLGGVPQVALGAMQAQVEAWQAKPPVQAWPQEPQWRMSDATSTQLWRGTAPQSVTVDGVVAQTQVPPPQTPRPQAWPQEPQFRMSVARSTQAPRQAVCPPRHPQVPLTQAAPAMQETLQLPQ